MATQLHCRFPGPRPGTKSDGVVILLASITLVMAGAAQAGQPVARPPDAVRLPRVVLEKSYRFERAEVLPSMKTGTRGRLTVSRVTYPEHNALLWELAVQAPPERGVEFDIPPFEFVVRFPETAATTVHWSVGSRAQADDFRPIRRQLRPSKPLRFASVGGRSSDGVLPYFNLARPHGGLILAVGWSGDWEALFEQTSTSCVRVRVGLKRRGPLQLEPGQRLRLPSLLLLAYQGSWIRGQNRFRRLMLDELRPQPGAAPTELMPVAASVHGEFAFNDTSEVGLIDLVQRIARSKLPLDTIWLDAGWGRGGFPRGQGNIDPDPNRFPRGLTPVARVVHEAGFRFLVWYEPERVMKGTWIDRTFPQWLLRPGAPLKSAYRYLKDDGFRLFDLGHPSALRWLIGWLEDQVQRHGVDVLRLDCNLPPGVFWDTQSGPWSPVTLEVRHVNGLYRLLDTLQRRFPKLIIDTCASGGRRIDFELLRRSVVLWRSDSCWDDEQYPRNVQAMAYGLSLWLPLHGLGAAATDTVSLRSGMGACASFPINYRDRTAVERLRQHLAQYLPVRDLFLADFYPLTPWLTDPHRWIAWQYHEQATGRGLVLAFATAPRASIRIRLNGLEANAHYRIVNWDRPSSMLCRSGRELATEGFSLPVGPGDRAIVWQYQRAPQCKAELHGAPFGQPR